MPDECSRVPRSASFAYQVECDVRAEAALVRRDVFRRIASGRGFYDGQHGNEAPLPPPTGYTFAKHQADVRRAMKGARIKDPDFTAAKLNSLKWQDDGLKPSDLVIAPRQQQRCGGKLIIPDPGSQELAKATGYGEVGPLLYTRPGPTVQSEMSKDDEDFEDSDPDQPMFPKDDAQWKHGKSVKWGDGVEILAVAQRYKDPTCEEVQPLKQYSKE